MRRAAATIAACGDLVSAGVPTERSQLSIQSTSTIDEGHDDQVRRSLRSTKAHENEEERASLENLKTLVGETSVAKSSTNLAKSLEGPGITRVVEKFAKEIQDDIRKSINYYLERKTPPAVLFKELELSKLPRTHIKWTLYGEYRTEFAKKFPSMISRGIGYKA